MHESNRTRARPALALVLLTLLAAGPLHAQPGEGRSEEEAVLEVVQAFFDAIGARDTTAFRALQLPEAQAIAIGTQGGRTTYRARGVDADLPGLGAAGPALLERMWEPEVRISGPLATVWAPYDFYRDGQFSHCGIDAFQLIRTAQAWKVAAITYTVVPDRDACPPSPLGPPR
jgi:hypothetical protein